MKLVKIGIVIVVLAGISFASSYFIAKKSAVAAATTAPATKPAPVATAIEPVVPDTQKEQQLDTLVKDLRRHIDECRRRSDELDLREQRLALTQESLRKRSEELETLQLKLVAPLTDLREAQADLKKMQVAISQQEKANLKHTALIYEKMDPAKSGRILSDMCGSSQENDAAKILYFMTERGAAKVLSEISDKGLAASLTQKLNDVRDDPAPEKQGKEK